ncbi:dipeptide epimerase [Melioribacter sp. OK-6-Me]|uniref:dipeptide epimerase n=1 Tax=unclassified Melioribacter TaxID=2627329 RepID=UPI003ED8F26E
MKITTKKFTLSLKDQFNISYYSRNTTPAVLVKVEDNDNIVGYGEASLPQYMKENQESVINFIKGLEISEISEFNQLIDYLNSLNEKANFNRTALASVDIALHDYLGKKLNKPVREFYNLLDKKEIKTSYTIGLDSPEMIERKIKDAVGFDIYKIKLGKKHNHNKEIIRIIRQATDKPLYVDLNQAWGGIKDDSSENGKLGIGFFNDFLAWLEENNVILVEQPVPAGEDEVIESLKGNSSLPIIADESIRNLEDIERVGAFYDGFNFKLMKCGGINYTFKLIEAARLMNKKVMLGCMTETSCGISAALQLAQLADYIDLDGNLLINNDPFEGHEFSNGKFLLNNFPGLGISPLKNLF